MKWAALGLCLVLALACRGLPNDSHAQAVRFAKAPAHGEYTELIAESRALIDSVIQARNIPGLSIAVSVDGETAWSEGFGYADIEQQTAVTTTTKFRIGSMFFDSVDLIT